MAKIYINSMLNMTIKGHNISYLFREIYYILPEEVVK